MNHFNLEKGLFTQLFTAIQQSDLGISGDIVLNVRDRDFPKNDYQNAFNTINRLHTQMRAKAEQRQAQLHQEEMNYKSGFLKMTPKEWLLRQQRETAKTQRIDRALRQFNIVLDGLNSLRAGEKR